MIIDHIDHCMSSAGAHPLFPKGFEYLRDFDPATPDGKYELDGKRLFAMVQRYVTAPEAIKAWEAHRRYADIQYIVSGTEMILYAPVADLTPDLPYNDVKDAEKFAGVASANSVALIVPPKTFCVFYPQDGHKPGCLIDSAAPIVKVVLKVLLHD